MKLGVSSSSFNPLFTKSRISMMEAIMFVGTKTEADCFELLSQFWDSGSDENKQAKEDRDLMTEHNFETSCYTLDSNFVVCDETADRTCIECCIETVFNTTFSANARCVLQYCSAVRIGCCGLC